MYWIQTDSTYILKLLFIQTSEKERSVGSLKFLTSILKDSYFAHQASPFDIIFKGTFLFNIYIFSFRKVSVYYTCTVPLSTADVSGLDIVRTNRELAVQELNAWLIIQVIVGQISDKSSNNIAFCDKNVKYCTYINCAEDHKIQNWA